MTVRPNKYIFQMQSETDKKLRLRKINIEVSGEIRDDNLRQLVYIFTDIAADILNRNGYSPDCWRARESEA